VTSGLFVTGTDTGVGKTVITAGLASALRARGHAVGVVKPVQSGALAEDPSGDAARLVRLAGLSETPAEVAPYAFAAPLAPAVAAGLEGRRVDRDVVLDAVQSIAARYDAVLVEGAGGLMVPLAEDWTVADLAGALGLPLLVVARAGLGTVNHTVLTVLVARQHGLDPAGVVLNGATDESSRTNALLIERHAGVPVVGRTPQLVGELTSERLRTLVEQHIDVDALVRSAICSKEALRA
jgi:dethiobiotin synthetase